MFHTRRVAQHRLVESSVSRIHVVANVPCGDGKSLAWTLPAVAARLKGVHSGCTIVVAPYKFLTFFHSEAASSFLDPFDGYVEVLGSDSFGPQTFPGELADERVLPDIVFVSPEALRNLIQYQSARLGRLCSGGHIHRIIVDEIHTLFMEEFRSVYEYFPRLSTLGIPVTVMSGTVPPPFRDHLLRYLGLSREGLTPEIIDGGDVLGHFPRDFRFGCRVVKAPVQEAVRYVRSKSTSTEACHIFVACKRDGEAISKIFAAQGNITSSLLHSDLTREEQSEIAVSWRESSIDALISTSLALVGNENSACKHIVFVGYLFNMMAVIQAINRLRPKQRYGRASVQFFVRDMTDAELSRRWHEEERPAFQALVARGIVPSDTIFP